MSRRIKYSHRLDSDLYTRAQRLDVSITKIFEKALARLIKDRKCPTCQQFIKNKKD